jgi:hypothetical protein
MDKSAHQFVVRALLCTLCAVVIAGHAVDARADWPMFHQNFAYSGVSTVNSSYPRLDLVVLWNFTVNSSITSSPVAGDLNGDGREEVVVGADDGTVYVLDSKGSLLWWYTTGGRIGGSPFIGNLLRNNATLQVLVGSADGGVYAFSHDGKLLWKFQTRGAISASPVIASIGNGPKPGVIFGSEDGTLYILHSDGTEFWRYYFWVPISFSPTIADVEGKGDPDIVFSSGDRLNAVSFTPFKIIVSAVGSEVTTYAPADGSDLFIGTESGRVYKMSFTSVGANESLIPTGYDRFYWLNHSRSIEVFQPTSLFNCSKAVRSTPAFANLDKNKVNGLEYVFGCDDGNVYVIWHKSNDSADFKALWYTTNDAVRSSPAIADLEGDGNFEVIVGSDDGNLYILNASGGGRWSYATGGRVSSPAVSDLENNSFLDIIVGTSKGVLYCFSSGTSIVRSAGLSDYIAAVMLMKKLDFGNATEYGVRALRSYESINYSKGVEDVNNLFLDISMKEHCKAAQEFYNRNLYEESVKEIETANLVYYEARRQVKSDCNELLPEALAYFYYYKALDLFNAGSLEAAKVNAQNASIVSMRTTNSFISVQSSVLLNKIDNIETAHIVFGNATMAYRRNASIGEVLGLLDVAERMYVENNASKVIYDPVRMSIYAMRGDTMLRNVSDLLNNSQFQKGYDLAVKTQALCANASIMPCVARVNVIIKNTKVFVDGNNLLDQANRYYTATDFITAAEYAQKARDMYLSGNYTDKALEAEDILNKSTSMRQLAGTKGGIMDQLNNPVVIVVLITVAIAVVIVVTRPRLQVMFRGYMGFGETLAFAGVRHAEAGVPAAKPKAERVGRGETFRKSGHVGSGEVVPGMFRKLQPRLEPSIARRFGETLLRLQHAGIGEALSRARGLFSRLGAGEAVRDKSLHHGVGEAVRLRDKTAVKPASFARAMAHADVRGSFRKSRNSGVGKAVMKHEERKIPVVQTRRGGILPGSGVGRDFWGFYRERRRR